MAPLTKEQKELLGEALVLAGILALMALWLVAVGPM